MDYDNDGVRDVLTGSYTGELYLFRGRKGTTLAPRECLKDKDQKPLEGGHSVTVEAVDLDADGDLDLLVGTRVTAVVTFENVGTRSAPAYSGGAKPLKTQGGKTIKGSNAHYADWDGDGVRDLLTGSEHGAVVWYRNIGKDDAPVFAEALPLLGEPSLDRSLEGAVPPTPGMRTKVHVTDWNGDGRPDLLVGDVTWQEYETAPLSPADLAEKAQLMPAYDEVRARVKTSSAARKAAKESGDGTWTAEREDVHQKLLDEFGTLAEKMRKFDHNKKTTTHGWVWLYLRKPATEKTGAPPPPKAARTTQGPVTLVTSIEPVAPEAGSTATLSVRLDLDEGWHAYGVVDPDSGDTPVAVELLPNDALSADGAWKSPAGEPDPGQPGRTILTGSNVFTRRVKILKVPATLTVRITWQVCDENQCLPPAKVEQTVAVGSVPPGH